MWSLATQSAKFYLWESASWSVKSWDCGKWGNVISAEWHPKDSIIILAFEKASTLIVVHVTQVCRMLIVIQKSERFFPAFLFKSNHANKELRLCVGFPHNYVLSCSWVSDLVMNYRIPLHWIPNGMDWIYSSSMPSLQSKTIDPGLSLFIQM